MDGQDVIKFATLEHNIGIGNVQAVGLVEQLTNPQKRHNMEDKEIVMEILETLEIAIHIIAIVSTIDV